MFREEKNVRQLSCGNGGKREEWACMSDWTETPRTRRGAERVASRLFEKKTAEHRTARHGEAGWSESTTPHGGVVCCVRCGDMPNIYLFKRLNNFEHGAKSHGALSEFLSMFGLEFLGKRALVGFNVLDFLKRVLYRIGESFFINKQNLD